MGKYRNYIKKNKLSIIIALIYAAITLTIVIFHENWRDEAQSWLIARDLSIIDIFKQMKYEGHPVLWYLILLPFAKLGLPYITVNIISWSIMCTTAYILLKNAPFDKYIKIIILFTTPFLYWYPVIARSYCLIALAIVLIASTYKKRKEEPIKYVLSIMLLSYTHVIMFALVGLLYLFFFFEEIILKFKKKTKEEKKKIIIALVLALIGLAVLFLQLFASLKTNANVGSNFNISIELLKSMYNNLITICDLLFGIEFGYFCFIILAGLFIYELIKHFKNAVIIALSIAFQLFIYSCIYYASGQRAAAILFIILLFAWIQAEEAEKIGGAEGKSKKIAWFSILFTFLLTINIANTIVCVEKELKYSYSAAKETANYIKDNIGKTDIICSHIPMGSAIIPYTNNKFYSPQLDKYFSFTTWDKENENQNNVPIEDIIENINKRFEKKENLYFIYCFNWEEEKIEDFITKTNAVEVFKSNQELIRGDERYIIYKLYNN